jgi:hypothetical protein
MTRENRKVLDVDGLRAQQRTIRKWELSYYTQHGGGPDLAPPERGGVTLKF